MLDTTGTTLDQVKIILDVTTANITTMADLLNPVKLFPNSFESLTVTTKFGNRGIYVNTSGSVNQNLLTQLPQYVIRTIS